LGSGELQPAGELVDADLVGLERVPGEVAAHRALVARSDRVLPAEAGDEVSAGVADRARAELANELDDVEAEAVLVRGGVVRLVDAVVDAATEVLDEGSEDPSVQRGDDGVPVDGDLCGGHDFPFLRARGSALGRMEARVQRATAAARGWWASSWASR